MQVPEPIIATLTLSDNSIIQIPGSGILTSQATSNFRQTALNIEISNNCTSLGYGCFAQYDEITSITIPNTVTQIEGRVFYDCDKLTFVELPNTLTNLGEGVFWDTALNSISIPEGVKRVPNNVCNSCPDLTSVSLPSTITNILEKAFANCPKLKDIYYNGTMAQWQAIDKADIWHTGNYNLVIHCTDGDIQKY